MSQPYEKEFFALGAKYDADMALYPRPSAERMKARAEFWHGVKALREKHNALWNMTPLEDFIKL